MPKVFWKGAISFGLVMIPVSMSVAIHERPLRFNYLHKKDLVKPEQVLHCPEDDEYFSVKDTVRGYEYAKGRYVVITDKDFEKVSLKTTRSIDIQSFVAAEEIDPVYFFDSHHLEPQPMGVKTFHLLREAMLSSGRVGIAKVVFARKEHLACLRPYGKGLILHSMRYPAEIEPSPELPETGAKLTDAELKMAGSLIDGMTKPFRPEEYRDEYREALQKIIDAKVKGVKPEIPVGGEVIDETPDLMAALEASLARTKARAGSGKE